jgi:hypothetical protein
MIYLFIPRILNELLTTQDIILLSYIKIIDNT